MVQHLQEKKIEDEARDEEEKLEDASSSSRSDHNEANSEAETSMLAVAGSAQQSRSPNPPSPTVDECPDGPPPLPYDLREHKLTITLFWSLIATECCFIPISFYYGLSNATDLRPGAMFAIITAVFGFVTGFEYAIRGWRLIKKSDEYRPLNNSPRWSGLDSTHYALMTPYTIMTAAMIGFSIPEPPHTRGLAIVLALGLIICGLTLMGTGIAHALRWRLKFRLSSHVKGSICPPLTFCIMEDITANDGKGGKKYREAAMARYNASPRFRRLLVELLWVWSISSILLGAALIAVIYSVRREVAYGVGWAAPNIYGAVGAFLTIKWAQRSLRTEREMWRSDRNSGEVAA